MCVYVCVTMINYFCINLHIKFCNNVPDSCTLPDTYAYMHAKGSPYICVDLVCYFCDCVPFTSEDNGGNDGNDLGMDGGSVRG